MSTTLQSSFSRHETFHPRYGWLVRGAREASADPGVFLRPDATTVLGVGKNMVRAMRYWCVATKLLEDVKREDNPRVKDVQLTSFGSRLLSDDGWDPYLEDPASLWLLHWKLLSTTCMAPAWWSVFNTPRMQSFDEATLLRELRALADIHRWEGVADNSLVKDIRCLLRMYAGVTAGRDLPEDSVDSPFGELELIRRVPGTKDLFAVSVGPKPTLPDEVVAYAVLDFLRDRDATARVVTVAGLAHTPGSPGRAFGLTEAALSEALQRAANCHPHLLQITHAAGIRQVALAVETEPEQMLDAHYLVAGAA